MTSLLRHARELTTGAGSSAHWAKVLAILVVVLAGADAACNLTVPISDATHLDVGGSILGLGLHLAEPKGGASAKGSITISLPQFISCPNWSIIGSSHKFWSTARFSLDMYLASDPSEIVVKAGSVPIHVHGIAMSISSFGLLNGSLINGFEGTGALRIVEGSADAMGHDFDLRTKVDSPVQMTAHISACQGAPNFELSMSLFGAFKSDSLPGSKSHIDMIATVVALPSTTQPSASSIATIEPSSGAWNEPTTITLTGPGLIDPSGRPMAVDILSARRGGLVSCMDVSVPGGEELGQSSSRRGDDDEEGGRKGNKGEDEEEAEQAEGEAVESSRRRRNRNRRQLFAAAVHARARAARLRRERLARNAPLLAHAAEPGAPAAHGGSPAGSSFVPPGGAQRSGSSGGSTAGLTGSADGALSAAAGRPLLINEAVAVLAASKKAMAAAPQSTGRHQQPQHAQRSSGHAEQPAGGDLHALARMLAELDEAQLEGLAQAGPSAIATLPAGGRGTAAASAGAGQESAVGQTRPQTPSRAAFLAAIEKRRGGESPPPGPPPATIVCTIPPGLPGDVANVQLADGGGCGAPKVPFTFSDSLCNNDLHAGCLLLPHGDFNESACACACAPGFHGARCQMCDASRPASCGEGASCVGADFRFFRGEVHSKSYECTPADMPAAFGSVAVTVECEGREDAPGMGVCRLQVGGGSALNPAEAPGIVCEAHGCAFDDGSASARCAQVTCNMGDYGPVVQSLIGRETIQGSISFDCARAHADGRARCVLLVSDLPIPISADCAVTECVPNAVLAAMRKQRTIQLVLALSALVAAVLLVVVLPIVLCLALRTPRTLAATLKRIGPPLGSTAPPPRHSAATAQGDDDDDNVPTASELDALPPTYAGALVPGAGGRAGATTAAVANGGSTGVGKGAASASEGLGGHTTLVSELRFNGLSVVAANGRVLLNEVSGVARAGELLGVMGPSGSGKTTMLDVIAGLPPVGARTTGEALLDDRPLKLGASYPPSLVAYCQQHDLLPATLSVLECVSLAAMLTLPAAWPTKAKLRRAIDALGEVGLNHVADSIIGDATMVSAHGRVSGGERRRISLATALVASPAILLCDEVTSGLDSTTAYAMVRTLRALARRGRIVVLSIHQPSSRAFLGLDRLLLLHRGEIVLAAPTSELSAACDGAGVPCAPGFNLADHLLDVLAADADGDVSHRLAQRSSWAPIDPAAFEARRSALAASASGAGGWKLRPQESPLRRARVELRALFWRASVSVVRHPSLLRLHLMVAVFSAAAVGGLFHGLGNDVSGLQNRCAARVRTQAHAPPCPPAHLVCVPRWPRSLSPPQDRRGLLRARPLRLLRALSDGSLHGRVEPLAEGDPQRLLRPARTPALQADARRTAPARGAGVRILRCFLPVGEPPRATRPRTDSAAEQRGCKASNACLPNLNRRAVARVLAAWLSAHVHAHRAFLMCPCRAAGKL